MDETGIFSKLVDWFVPVAFVEELEQLQRGRMTVSFAFAILIFWLPPIVNHGVSSVAVGIIIGCLVLLVPFLLKLTSSLIFAENLLIFTVSLATLYCSFLNGGFESNVLLLCPIPIVAAAMMLRNWRALFWLIVNGAGVYVLFHLASTGFEFPEFPATGFGTVIFDCMCLVVLLLILVSIWEISRREAFAHREEELVKSEDLSGKLREIVAGIRKNAESIHASSEELSKSSKTMKEGTDDIAVIEAEASTSITQSTNTVQELAHSMKETLQQIQDLNATTSATKEKGEYGEKIVQASREAINKIEGSGLEIEGLLQMIAEIADSAHLLALNAAIEAAKAGDSGKGFSVVVESIRDLAQKSNDAVVDIRKLIKQNSYIVRAGKNIIADTGEIFEQINEEVSDIAIQVQEISASLNEQEIGIREVALGSEEIAGTSEDNVILVQELAMSVDSNSATIENLKQIAEQLDVQVSRFTV